MDLRSIDFVEDYRKRKETLLLRHGEALLELGATQVLNVLLESVNAKRAMEFARQRNPNKWGASDYHVAGSGSQPSNNPQLGSISYLNILADKGYIVLPKDFTGSKAPAACWEVDNVGWENQRGAKWWMDIGGFQASQIFMSRIASICSVPGVPGVLGVITLLVCLLCLACLACLVCLVCLIWCA